MVSADCVNTKSVGGMNLTPVPIIEALHKVFPMVDLDPASSELANKTINALECFDNKGDPYYYPRWGSDDEDHLAGYYCPEHAYEEGFCWGCGGFWAGVESFEFGYGNLCENCASAGDYEDLEDDYTYHEDCEDYELEGIL